MDTPPKSSTLTLYRVIVSALGMVLLAVSIIFGVMLATTWREYQAFNAREAAHRERLTELRIQKAEREAYLRKLLDDPEFLDRVVRERLGYSREGEIIFRFEQD